MKKLFYMVTTLLLFFVFIGSSFAAQKLSPDVVEKKKEGWYITGLPLVAYSTDEGFGYGVRIYWYDNGPRDGEFFEYQPYKMQIYGQFYMTTKWSQYHELNMDWYNIFGTNFRVNTALVYDAKLAEFYFGTGARTTAVGLQAADGTSYDNFADYEKGFLNSDGNVYSKYNLYEYKKPNWFANLYGTISEDFKYIVGLRIAYTDINDYSGDAATDAADAASARVTKLGLETPLGYGGGWTNYLMIGVAWNTLDYEPDPRNGFNLDFSFKTSGIWLGSEYDNYRETLAGRYYLTIWKPVTFAFRLGYTMSQGEMPFYDMGYFEFPYGRQAGLGGNRTLRGFPNNRFVGKNMILGNIEARWSFAEVTPWGQRFEFKLVGFYDVGNVYDEAYHLFSKPKFGDYQHSGGAGLVVAWNQATIIHVYWAMSAEYMAQIYVNFEHAIK